MGKGLRVTLVVAVLSIVSGLATPALATPGNITLASADDAATTNGNDDSLWPSVSADGTKVAFHSYATNLDSGDSDAAADIYVKDLTTGDITLASTNDAGIKANFGGLNPSLSADGMKVAFYSNATNLDPSGTDGHTDIYVKDLTTGDITLVSTSDTGTHGNSNSWDPKLSADGTKVAFWSNASNLDPGDTDDSDDVFVKDLTTGNITLASTDDAGIKGNDRSFDPSLSADGMHVAFQSIATNLDPGDTDSNRDMYVKDLTTGNITLASTSDSGTKGDGISVMPSLCADGTKVAFATDSTNLDPDDTDPTADVYVKNLTTGNITLVSTGDGGTKGNLDSILPSLSADGTKLAFISGATNLDPGDTDSFVDIYVKDLTTGNIMLASTDDTGIKGNSDSSMPSLAADGAEVAFATTSSNLDPADTDAIVDVYVKELPVATGTADLSITKSDRRDPVRVGRRIVYTIKVQNLGPDPATGVTVTDQLPMGVSFVSATSRRGTCSQAAGTVTCTYGSRLRGGGRRVATIVVTAPPTPGTISNTAHVTANELDPGYGNNEATQTTGVI